MWRHGRRPGPCPGAAARRATRGHLPPKAVVASPSDPRKDSRRCRLQDSGPRDEIDQDQSSAPRTRKSRGALDHPADCRGTWWVRATSAVQCLAGRSSTPPPQQQQRRRSLAYSSPYRCSGGALRRRPHTRQPAVPGDGDDDDHGELGALPPSSATPRASFRWTAPAGDTRRHRGALPRRPPHGQPPPHRGQAHAGPSRAAKRRRGCCIPRAYQ